MGFLTGCSGAGESAEVSHSAEESQVEQSAEDSDDMEDDEADQGRAEEEIIADLKLVPGTPAVATTGKIAVAGTNMTMPIPLLEFVNKFCNFPDQVEGKGTLEEHLNSTDLTAAEEKFTCESKAMRGIKAEVVAEPVGKKTDVKPKDLAITNAFFWLENPFAAGFENFKDAIGEDNGLYIGMPFSQFQEKFGDPLQTGARWAEGIDTYRVLRYATVGGRNLNAFYFERKDPADEFLLSGVELQYYPEAISKHMK
ncbi:hypothetical protein [Trueperella pecoris]|uniref:hypothetical protein n=1 Tax=Trueperella pecoris TaxID=2733571 RepID=UPI00186B7DD3|nr:hypothetical protein [Trueperella pecoris]QOQ39223.1 hypothetical protein HLG82_07070 [Trueperella pecoris]